MLREQQMLTGSTCDAIFVNCVENIIEAGQSDFITPIDFLKPIECSIESRKSFS